MRTLLLPLLLATPTVARQDPGLQKVPVPPNIVLVVIDDFGVDLVGAYGEHPGAPATPRLDMLAQNGLLFSNCWTDPLCTPTRAQILTGRHGFRTGIGAVVAAAGNNPNVGLDRSEVTIAERLSTLRPYSYRSSAVGKWHLADDEDPVSFIAHPLHQGFKYYAGSMFNVSKAAVIEDDPCMINSIRHSYCQWIKNNNGVEECENRYATAWTTETAIARAEAMVEPWFLYVGYNAVHAPFHEPPAGCVDGCTCTSHPDDKIGDLKLMVEHLDGQIGDLVDGVRANHPETLFMLIGDNGTTGAAVDPYPQGCFVPERAKGSLYEPGVNVPLIINGPNVTTGEVSALVSSTDLYATIMKVAGGTTTAEDSVSLKRYFNNPDAPPGRSFVYAEEFRPNFAPGDFGDTDFQWHRRTIRDEAGYKLILRTDEFGVTQQELYFLGNDPCELTDLCLSGCPPSMPHLTAYNALVAELVAMGVGP